ncbi:MAG: molybdopterin-containing oxidoreductase family protein [Chloroflexota bacterium]
MKRRNFLKLSALSAAGTMALSACAAQPHPVVSRQTMPENHPVDGELWYATVCGACGAGCGVVVRTIEGRAKKMEGNPEHPINRGTLCPRGQAALQLLYNQDRVRGPQKRRGDKGRADFEPIAWDAAIAEAAQQLQQAAGRGQGSVVVLSGYADGHTGLVLDRFARALGGPGRVSLEPLSSSSLERAVNRAVYGVEAPALYDIANADYVIAFGADLLENGPSPVYYEQAYGNFRQGRPGRRGRWTQVEARMSLTGANADSWLPARPGTEGVVALGIAHLILNENRQARENGLSEADANAWRGALGEYQPERVAQLTGLRVDDLRRVAQEFANGRPSLAIAGGSALSYSNAFNTAMAVNALNVIAGNVGREGGVRFVPPLGLGEGLQTQPAAFRDVQTLVDRMRNGQVQALVLYDANPAYLLSALNAGEALARVPYIVSLSSFVDDSAAYADLVLPDHSFLERWGTSIPEGGADRPLVTTMQPVVEPLYDTRPAADSLIAIAKAMGGPAAQALPWNNLTDALREFAGQIQQANRGSVRGGTADEVWQNVLQRGGWWDDNPPTAAPLAPNRQATLGALRFEEPQFQGDAGEFPFVLQVFESSSFGDGRGAVLPWLQELPDPITTVVWGSWVELNPETARRLGVEEGDLITIESPRGQVQARVFRHPGLRPDVVAMPIGQGHTYFGQSTTATNRGVNPLNIVAPVVESQAGIWAHGATRVKVAKSSGPGRMVTIEGNNAKLPGKAFFE